MFVEILLMYIIFPISILLKARKKKDVHPQHLISKTETDAFKGIAAWMVVWTHYTTYLANEGYHLGILNPFSKLGSFGVAIFFFLSGYGLFMSSGNRLKPYFLTKRIATVYIPLILVQILSFFVLHKGYTGWNMVLYFLGFIEPKWFIINILLFYIVYWLVWHIKGQRKKILSMFIFTIILTVFWLLVGVEDYWYATIVLFPLGILFAYKQDTIINILSHKKYSIVFLATICLLSLSLIIYQFWNSSFAVLGKTFAGIFLVLICIEIMEKWELSSPVMQWFGRMSLFIYIVHSSVYVFIETNFHLDLPEKTLIFLVLTIVIAFGLYKLDNSFNNKLFSKLKI